VKNLAIIVLFLATSLFAQRPPTTDDAETAYPGLDFALHSAFIKCYVNRWRGTETSEIKGAHANLKMTCAGFWKKFVDGTENPITADRLPSPFEITESSGTIGIPFSVWNGYLSATLAISTDNPLRKSK